MAKPATTLTIIPVLPKGKAVTFGMIGSAPLEPSSSGSAGGWQIVDRPKQKAATQWFDAAPQQFSLALILDGNGLSIETSCAQVFGWQYPTPGAQQTPVLEVVGPISPQASGLYWVLSSLKMDDDAAIRNPSTGDRIQQPVDLVLLEYVPTTASVLTNLSPAKAAQLNLTANGTSASRRTYVVRKGDTLAKIAARVLGNFALWPQIASLNGIRDPRSTSEVAPGRKLVLPS